MRGCKHDLETSENNTKDESNGTESSSLTSATPIVLSKRFLKSVHKNMECTFYPKDRREASYSKLFILRLGTPQGAATL